MTKLEKAWFALAEIASITMIFGGWIMSDYHWFGYVIFGVGIFYSIFLAISYHQGMTLKDDD